MSAIHGAAEKCSCIFGMSAIHGRQKKRAGFVCRPVCSVAEATRKA
jgi:hypothetical protein